MAIKALFIASVIMSYPGLALAQASPSDSESPPAAALTEVSREAIDRVWSGHSVLSAILLTPKRLYIGYYDANRQLTVAMRPLNGSNWTYTRLDVWNNWDSHNYITLAEDRAGRIHLAGNMHSSPLILFQSDSSGDPMSLKRVPVAVEAEQEKITTYPVFLKSDDGALILKYRQGYSGNGNEIYNRFDAEAGVWSRLTKAPLVDGEGRRNAYFVGPVKGPDGQFHITWVWRETPMAETNHDLSYARSPDLVHWFRADGTPLTLPMRMQTAEIVDPVPVEGGMINGNTKIGFDAQRRPIISYHRFDANGDTQIYVARYEGRTAGKSGWRIAQASRWKGYRWDFRGGGSLNSEIFVFAPEAVGNGLLKVPVVRLGARTDLFLRADDLSYVETRSAQTLTDRLKASVTVPADMQLNVVSAKSPDGRIYALVWPARPAQRDLPGRDIPDPTTLLLLTLKPETSAAAE